MKYAYQVVVIAEDCLEDHLNALGADGWRLLHLEGGRTLARDGGVYPAVRCVLCREGARVPAAPPVGTPVPQLGRKR